MERYLAALAALGGLATIGAGIDFMLRKKEKKKFKDWMIDWWIRFDDVKWNNFGRKEAGQAVGLLDRWVGSKFWSRRRWRAAVVVMLGCLAFAATFHILFTAFLSGRIYSTTGSWPIDVWEFWSTTALGWMYLATRIVGYTVALALSFSLARLIAKAVERWAPRGALSFVFFAALVFAHVAMLLFWSQIVDILIAIPSSVAAVLLGDVTATKFVVKMFFELPVPAHYGPDHLVTLSLWAADFVANGLRIGFALLFLLSISFNLSSSRS